MKPKKARFVSAMLLGIFLFTGCTANNQRVELPGPRPDGKYDNHAYLVDSSSMNLARAMTSFVTLQTKTKFETQDGEVVQDASTGDGPIDALFKAVDRITDLPGKLMEYHIDAVTGGKDALGEVALLVKCKGFTVRGRAASTDILEASLKAYLRWRMRGPRIRKNV